VIGGLRNNNKLLFFYSHGEARALMKGSVLEVVADWGCNPLDGEHGWALPLNIGSQRFHEGLRELFQSLSCLCRIATYFRGRVMCFVALCPRS
jgi:hypothetical protein